jgi:hypothetical protein
MSANIQPSPEGSAPATAKRAGSPHGGVDGRKRKKTQEVQEESKAVTDFGSLSAELLREIIKNV